MWEFDIQKNPNNLVYKKLFSFNEIIPSKDMTTEYYETFLNIAKPYELELDVVSQETYYLICQELNQSIPKPLFPSPRRLLSY